MKPEILVKANDLQESNEVLEKHLGKIAEVRKAGETEGMWFSFISGKKIDAKDIYGQQKNLSEILYQDYLPTEIIDDLLDKYVELCSKELEKQKMELADL